MNKESNKTSWILFTMSIGLLFVAMSPQTSQPMIGTIGGLIIILLAVLLLRKQRRLQREAEILEQRKEQKRQKISK